MRNDNNLRNEQNGKVTSIVAKMHLIRNYINKQQITLTTQKTMKEGFVIDGRDIGSVVFKYADLKLFIDPTKNKKAVNPEIRTDFDHRIAMSFAVLGSKIGKLHINESDSIRTSFPTFKEQFNKAGGNLNWRK